MNEKQRSAKGQRQYEKWKATMERRYGKSVSEIMRDNGRVGGKRGHAGKGYNAHPEMASEMGKRGAVKRWEKYRQDRANVQGASMGTIKKQSRSAKRGASKLARFHIYFEAIDG